MYIDFLINVFRDNAKANAIWRNEFSTYSRLLNLIDYWKDEIASHEITPGSVVCLTGDFSPDTIALLLALIEQSCIILPQCNSNATSSAKRVHLAHVQFTFKVSEKGKASVAKHSGTSSHPLYEKLRQARHPGLIMFTSGTSGEPKGAVHDLVCLLEKFKTRRTTLRTLIFLTFDHWGGLNTMFHSLSNGSTVIALNDRSPENVCSRIEEHKVELLPVSPTFLNLLLVSEAYKKYDLSSLRTISYGAEPMSQWTLNRLKAVFPHVRLHQTYGLIEVGVLRSRSKGDDSLWVKVGGEGFQTRVVDGCLQIKANSAMLGYLNAPSPFTNDGWFMTGDTVEVQGDYVKILGRKSEVINVGGEKVYPAEIEGVIQSIDNVAEVTVYGEKNPLMGTIVCARVCLLEEENPEEFSLRLKKYCQERLDKFKVPIRIQITGEKQFNDRFKKVRC